MKPPVLPLLLLCAGISSAQTGEGAKLYTEQVQPLLAKNCLGCHNAKLKQAGLDLSSRESLLRGSENGPVVVPGNPDASHLYKAVAHLEQPSMPFKGNKLPDADIALLAKWIKAGVPYDGNSTESAAAAPEHWAFRKPVRPPVPGSFRNPIDGFLAAEWSKHKLKASPEADRRTLIRRVYLDLIGLPPSPDEVRAFAASKAPDAYEKIVDQLLASPRYGERWGRHWLDVWRYSDWYGWRKENQVRYSQRHIWRWRDWTVESLNENKSYGRMIEEMLAGDEIAPADPQIVRATGYLARSWYLFNRNVWLQDAPEYTATAFLGLTMKCARCHSHKYDPITHVDYYRFRAIFEPFGVRIDRVPGEADPVKGGLARVFDSDLSTPTYRFIRGNEKNPETDKPLTPGVPEFIGAKFEIQPVPVPRDAMFPDGREFVQRDLIQSAEADIDKAKGDLKKAREKAVEAAVAQDGSETTGADRPAAERKAQEEITAAEKHLAWVEATLPAVKARAAADRAKYSGSDAAALEKLSEEARKLERHASILKAEEELYLANRAMEKAGSDEKKLAGAKKKLEDAVKALGEAKDSYTPLGPVYPDTSSGRRLALAHWIAGKDNPLTARVAINHMWLRHFGKALVPTVFNFGRSGKPPTHPELLDWLAVEFMERGWDMKHMHRLMVTSSAYRMQSAWKPGDPNAAADLDNVYLWRMNTRRAEAEVVRDSLLQITGKLDTAMGGPEIDEKKGEQIFRRSIYFRHAPDLQEQMLKVFDVANPNECFERSSSIVPQQALAMTNSDLSFSASRWLHEMLAGKSATQGAGLERLIPAAFDIVLGRAPTAPELAASRQYLEEQAALYRKSTELTPFPAGGSPSVAAAADPEGRAFESFLHALLNHNDFVTIR
jgi:hypothetical protein